MLLAWKAVREAGGQDALAGLTRLTEDTLQELLVEAYEMKHQEIMETLARLEQNDSKAADLLREMLDEITRFREYSALFDPDSASRLYVASTYLAELNLDRSARRLTLAASALETLPRTVQALEAVVNRLGSMEGYWR